MLYKYIHNICVAFDQLINAITGGDPDETISSRVGKCQRGDHGLLVKVVFTPVAWAINLAFFWQGWNHCISAIEEDKGQLDLFK